VRIPKEEVKVLLTSHFLLQASLDLASHPRYLGCQPSKTNFRGTEIRNGYWSLLHSLEIVCGKLYSSCRTLEVDVYLA
jgi:hypothetical protein